MVTAAMKSEDDWQESYDKSRQYVEKQRHYSADKGSHSQGYGLPSGYGCESWTIGSGRTEELMPLNFGAREES